MTGRYDDIIGLPRPKSRHPAMPMEKRAAQFSPFAALSGFEEAIGERGRLTERRPELDESEKERIGEVISGAIAEGTRLRLVLFVPDLQKEGGSFSTVDAVPERFDALSGEIVLEGRRRIPVSSVVSAEPLGESR